MIGPADHHKETLTLERKKPPQHFRFLHPKIAGEAID